MSLVLDITHVTHYRFARPVRLGEHRVMLRPRGSHDVRVLATDLVVNPLPLDVHLVQDAYSNSIAIVRSRKSAPELRLVATFTVEHTGTPALDLPLDPEAHSWPFRYAPDEQPVLAPYIEGSYDDPVGMLAAWARQSTGGNGPRDILVAMTRRIRDTMRHRARLEGGVQTPYETLECSSGSCRDFATLMIEAAGRLGYAARFVSGYLYSTELDPNVTGDARAGSTHAWLEAYLPDAGWLPFDPTNNLVGCSQLVSVGIACHASQAVPVSGSWIGDPADFKGTDVDVQVRRARPG